LTTSAGGSAVMSTRSMRFPDFVKKLSENRRNVLCVKEIESRLTTPESRIRSHSHGTPQSATQAAGHDLGGPRRVVEADRADPQGLLAPQAHGSAAGPLEEDPQRHHLSDAQRLPVGPTARAVRPQEHRPRLVPAPGRGGHLREDLGRAGRRVRRARRGAVGVAERRRDAGQGQVRGGKRRAGTPPIAARRAPRRAW
jgi:hypothetical protein